MDLKNTHKSKINEYKLSTDVFIAQIDNFTASTDTILKGIDKRYIQFYFCTKVIIIFIIICIFTYYLKYDYNEYS